MQGVPFFAAMMCYIQFAILITFGHFRDQCGRIFGYSRYKSVCTKKGFAQLLVQWENFFTNRIYHRGQDAFNRPIANAPGTRIDVIERVSIDGNKTLQHRKGCIKRCINLASYNYLGFADDWMSECSKIVFPSVEKYGVSATASLMEFGKMAVHEELEAAIAKFVGKPAAIVYNMGYGTNATTIPALMGNGALIVSDSLNHSSLVNGARASRATVAVFHHNDPEHLEQVLRMNIARGQPRTRRPWRKVMVMIEGIYSMEGEIASLRAIVDVAKKYKAYMYLDEAHSIGALGKTGRGVCEHAGVSPDEIDIMMGTFTKSFGGMGGYIAASEEIINYIRCTSSGSTYGVSLSPVVAQQVLHALNIISGADGTDRGYKKIKALRDNGNYFRKRLMELGVQTLGDFDSPIIPVMMYSCAKILKFSRECLRRNLAVAIVGFPATPLLLGRVRFCISAAHTMEDMDKALTEIEQISKLCRVRYQRHTMG